MPFIATAERIADERMGEVQRVLNLHLTRAKLSEGIAAALSIFVFVRIGFGPENGKLVVVQIFSWIDSGSLDVNWSLRVDTLTAVMLIVVTGVSSMVHVYSVEYMAHDPGVLLAIRGEARRQRVIHERAREIAILHVRLGQAVVRVPGVRMCRCVILKKTDGSVDPIPPQKCVGVAVEIDL